MNERDLKGFKLPRYVAGETPITESASRRCLRRLARASQRRYTHDWYYAGTNYATVQAERSRIYSELCRQGLAECTTNGWYRITDAGRAALGAAL